MPLFVPFWWDRNLMVGDRPFRSSQAFPLAILGSIIFRPNGNLKSTADVHPQRVSQHELSSSETISIVAKYRSFQLLFLKLQNLGHLHQLSHSDLYCTKPSEKFIKHISFFHKICFTSILIYAISIMFPSQLLSSNSRRTPDRERHFLHQTMHQVPKSRSPETQWLKVISDFGYVQNNSSISFPSLP